MAKLILTVEVDGVPDDPTTWEAEGLLTAQEAASNAAQAAAATAFPDQAAGGQVTTRSTVEFPRWGGLG